jgi:branched-chain amino acid transport system ATP-binding protein
MLRTENISVSYGGVKALENVSITVGEGELVGLIGANGAGKTTFIDAITGFAPATGTIELDGKVLSGLPAHKRFRAGLARTWQGSDLFEDISVRDNLQVAAQGLKPWDVFRDLLPFGTRHDEGCIDRALSLLNLREVADRVPTELPQGERKLVGVARALAGDPQTLCLDEPAAGLSSSEGRHLGRIFQQLAREGIGLLLVEHDVTMVLGVCTRVYVLERGKLLAEGTSEDIRNNPAVIAAYLGSTATATVVEPSLDALDSRPETTDVGIAR